MDSLTLSIWQGRGICGLRVLAAGSTLAAGCLGHTAGSAGRGGFKWRTASPLFGLFILLFLLLSIFFILQWRKARLFFQSSQRINIVFVFKTDCHSLWLFSFVFSLFHPYRQAILFDLPWPIHHICHRDRIILSLFTRWTINNPFSLHEQL